MNHDKSTILFEQAMENISDNVRNLEDKIGDLSYFLYMMDVDIDTKTRVDDMITSVYVCLDRLK